MTQIMPKPTQPLHDMPDVLTVEEAGRILRCSRSSAYQAARRGELPTIKLGRRLLVPTAALRRMLGEVDDPDDSVRRPKSQVPNSGRLTGAT